MESHATANDAAKRKTSRGGSFEQVQRSRPKMRLLYPRRFGLTDHQATIYDSQNVTIVPLEDIHYRKLPRPHAIFRVSCASAQETHISGHPAQGLTTHRLRGRCNKNAFYSYKIDGNY